MVKTGKIARYLSLSVLSLAIIFAVLNFFLTGHLERYLEKELIERTSQATDGFYRLSFDKLSIRFLNGELKLEGVVLRPDSVVFRQWAAIDSLPQVYVCMRIGLIDFKGVNLTWRWNYRRLHFNSFEIKSPEIDMFKALPTGRITEETRNADTKTLYELISPYMNVLSVKTLNLENARISYHVEGPVSPLLYRLENVNFHAYDFRLDSMSYRRGNLLYCQNFDFVINQPQTLLVSNEFYLKTDSIRLSTKDSLISIRNIKLEPQTLLWEKTNQKPSSYLLGQIKAVDVRGIRFERRETLNYLTARAFDIVSSRISLYDLTKEKGIPDTSAVSVRQGLADADSLVQALALYDVISPVLQSVAIDEINIEQTGLMYSKSIREQTDVYSLPEVDLHAREFLIDSLVEPGQELRYFRSIGLEARDIQGVVTSRNHRLDVKHLSMNTADGSLRLDSLRLKPLSVRSRNDYMSGSIDAIRMDGLAYDQGISADVLMIRSPRLDYYNVSNVSSSTGVRGTVSMNSHVDVENLLNPFLRYLSIRKISIQNADASFTDLSGPDTVTYRLNDFSFFADNFLVNERTNRMNRLPFSYENAGFRFRDFKNDLPGGEYHLSIKRGNLSTVTGRLSLEQVALTSSKKRLSFTSPILTLTRIRVPQNKFEKQLFAGDLLVENPVFDWEREDSTHLSSSMDSLTLGGLSYNDSHQLLFKRLQVYRGQLAYSWRLDTSGLRMIGQSDIHLAVCDAWMNLKSKDFQFGDIQLRTRDIQIPLDNGFYLLKIGNLDLVKSELRLDDVRLVSPFSKMEFAYKQPEHQDWFDVKVGRVMLTDIDWQRYWDDKRVHIGGLWINDVLLQNLKNRKIPVRPHLVPMIYEGLQKAPFRFSVDTAAVSDVSVVYEELALKGGKPGKLFFTDMNGHFAGLTNIVSSTDQYITLRANGKLMGSGPFKAVWKLPVDPRHDRFLLEGWLDSLDLLALNEIVTPLAPTEIRSGRTHDVSFFMDASSVSGRIQLNFPYKDLKVAVLKEKNGEMIRKGFLSHLANMILRKDNPSHPEKAGSKLRQVDITVVRDPYHSTFNYLWQMLRPALVESVGISKKEQDTARKAAGFFAKVKHFFGIRKKEREDPAEEMLQE